MFTHFSSPLRSRSGYSFVELLTTLAVIGIGASIATPALSGYVESVRSQQAMNHVVADISYARIMAVEEGRKSAIRMAADGAYTIERLTSTGTWETVRTENLRADYPGVTVSGDGMTLEFSSRGLVTSLGTEGKLRIATNSSADSIFVSPAGRVYRDY